MSQLKDRRTSMRVTAENIVLNSGEWFTQNELNSIATCQQFELDEWELSGKIFSIHHDGTDYYPTYALDSKDYRPLDAMAKVISIFSGHKNGWGMAFWFMSANGCLGAVTPKSIIATEPERVLAAARDEIEGVAYG